MSLLKNERIVRESERNSARLANPSSTAPGPEEPALSAVEGDGTIQSPARECRVGLGKLMSPYRTLCHSSWTSELRANQGETASAWQIQAPSHHRAKSRRDATIKSPARKCRVG
jgi:hypothetical protein